jgi:hypothetical protein
VRLVGGVVHGDSHIYGSNWGGAGGGSPGGL